MNFSPGPCWESCRRARPYSEYCRDGVCGGPTSAYLCHPGIIPAARRRGDPRASEGASWNCGSPPRLKLLPALVDSRGGARVTHGLGAASDGIQANTEILSKPDCFAYEVCDLIVGACILTLGRKCALIRMVKVASAKEHQSD
jgi:hypothetical protein